MRAEALANGLWRVMTENGTRIHIDIDRQRWTRIAAPGRVAEPLYGLWVQLGHGPYEVPPRQAGHAYEIPKPGTGKDVVRVGRSIALGRSMGEHHYLSIVVRVERVGDESALNPSERGALRDRN